MYTPLHDKKLLFIFFYGKERILGFKWYVKVICIPWETLHVCKLLNFLGNFTIDTTYKQLISSFFRHLS